MLKNSRTYTSTLPTITYFPIIIPYYTLYTILIHYRTIPYPNTFSNYALSQHIDPNYTLSYYVTELYPIFLIPHRSIFPHSVRLEQNLRASKLVRAVIKIHGEGVQENFFLKKSQSAENEPTLYLHTLQNPIASTSTQLITIIYPNSLPSAHTRTEQNCTPSYYIAYLDRLSRTVPYFNTMPEPHSILVHWAELYPIIIHRLNIQLVVQSLYPILIFEGSSTTPTWSIQSLPTSFIKKFYLVCIYHAPNLTQPTSRSERNLSNALTITL